METWVFWTCATLLVVSALAVVVETRPVRACVLSAGLAASATPLCLLLSAPLVAGALALFAGVMVGVAWWIAATPAGRPEGRPAATSGAASIRYVGATLVAGLVLELAWVFRRVRAAGLDAADTVRPSVLSAVTDHVVAAIVVGVLLVAVGVGASTLLHRDPG